VLGLVEGTEGPKVFAQVVEEQWVEERYWGLAFFLTGEKGIFHFQVLC